MNKCHFLAYLLFLLLLTSCGGGDSGSSCYVKEPPSINGETVQHSPLTIHDDTSFGYTGSFSVTAYNHSSRERITANWYSKTECGYVLWSYQCWSELHWRLSIPLVLGSNPISIQYDFDDGDCTRQKFSVDYDPPAAIEVLPVTDITLNSAKLNASVNPRGFQTDVYFIWENYDGTKSSTATQTVDGSSTVFVSDVLSGLLPGENYSYQVVAKNSKGTSTTNFIGFNTLIDSPILSASQAETVGIDYANLTGTVDPNGANSMAWFEWGTDPLLTVFSTTAPQYFGKGVIGTVSAELAGLNDDTTYYYRLAGENVVGLTNGPINSFDTYPLVPPSITSTSTANIKAYTGQLNALINPNGLTGTAWFQYSTDSAFSHYSETSHYSYPTSFTEQPLTINIYGLSGDTTYYFRLVTENEIGTTISDAQSFQTLTPPTVAAGVATNITATALTLNGSVNPQGYASEVWFEYGNSANMLNKRNRNSINIYSYGIEAGSVSGNFVNNDQTLDIQGLSSATTYYYRVGVYNPETGTTYSDITSASTASGNYSCWLKTYSRYSYLGKDRVQSLTETNEGGLIVSGIAEQYSGWGQSSGNMLLKLNNEGGVEWEKHFYGAYSSFINKTSDDGIILIRNKTIEKIDNTGEPQWQKSFSYSGSAFSEIYEISTGYVVIGTIYQADTDIEDILLIKLDVDGNIIWQYAYGGNENDSAKSLKPTTDGFILFGATESFGAGLNDIWVLKLTETGDIEWQHTYGGTGDDIPVDIQVTTNGYIFTGNTDSSGSGLDDIWLIKLANDGTIDWQYAFGSAYIDRVNSLATMADGFLLAGNQSANSYRYWLLKLDINGSKAWEKIYNYGQNEFKVKILSDGKILTGGSYNNSYGSYPDPDYRVTKLEPDGSCDTNFLSTSEYLSQLDTTVFPQDTTGAKYITNITSSDIDPQMIDSGVWVSQKIP